MEAILVPIICCLHTSHQAGEVNKILWLKSEAVVITFLN